MSISDRFGLVVFPRSENSGDAIQSLAAQRFLPRVDRLLDREALDAAPGVDRIKAIGAGWYAHDPERWPPHPTIDFLPISMHVSPRAIETWFGDDAVPYWRDLPHRLGARDLATLEAVQARGVDAWFSGCLTLTLTSRAADIARGRIVLCDVSPAVERHVRKSTALPVETVTHDEPARGEIASKLLNAERLLATYAGAAFVITTRLHAALPCLALGTPVFLITDAMDSYRFAGLDMLVNAGSQDDLLSGRSGFSLTGTTANPERHRTLQTDLARTVHDFLHGDGPGPSRTETVTAPRNRPLAPAHLTTQKDSMTHQPTADGSEDERRQIAPEPEVPHAALNSGDNVLLSEIVRLRAEQTANLRELETTLARLSADSSALMEARTEVARFQARYDILKEAYDQRSAAVMDAERLRIALADADHRIAVKDAYAEDLQVSREEAFRQLALEARQAEARAAAVVTLSHDDHAALEAARAEVRDLTDQLSALQSETGDRIAALETSRQAELAALEDARRDAADQAEKLRQLKAHTRALAADARRSAELESELALLQAALTDLLAGDHSFAPTNLPVIAQLQRLIDDLTTRHDLAQAQAVQANADLDRLRTFHAEAAGQAEALQAAIQALIGPDRSTLPTDLAGVSELAALIADLKARRAEAEARAEAAQAQGAADRLRLEEDLGHLRSQLSDASSDALALRETVETLERRLAEAEAELETAQKVRVAGEIETARVNGELELELRRLRVQQMGAQAEHQVLLQKAAEMERLPWRVIAIYRRVRRFLPEPLIRAVARLIPRRQP